MTTKKTKTPKKATKKVAELDLDIEEPADSDSDLDESKIEAEVAVVDLETVEDDVDIDEGAEDETEAGDKPLDELESEELEMLTEDEQSETIHVDERAEARAIRREALALEADADAKTEDEFVCQSCFLVKRTSQLANKTKKLCADCAS